MADSASSRAAVARAATSRSVTIADVASRAGVSKGSVSFVFNDRPGIAPGTRERILTAARDLGYVPSRAARSLSNRRSDAVGLVLNRPHDVLRADPFFPPFIAGVESIISPAGSAIVLRFVRPDEEAEVYTTLAGTGQIDGAILTDLRRGDPRPALLDSLGLPFVSLNRPPSASSGPAVRLDDRPGVQAAVRALADLGHRRIGHVAGPAEFLHSGARQDAWEQALHDCGLTTGPVVAADFSAAGGAAATETLLDSAQPPTAIVYASDLMAMAGMATAQRRGLRVPGDLSVVGFDDTDLAAHLHPSLSSVRTDAFGWGAAVGTLLLYVVGGGSADDLDLPPAQFIPRGSLGPPH
ncbi:LacI family DNA-binding transcriptional regulator [Nakamurella sp. A5-74]|uniref:LacI family DNA-binding transcriptional regulator n=1 Tax=Nakamurella sp. A5-74 TaxID=3158264 RepID=A0AAU8DMK7_9ACTN